MRGPSSLLLVVVGLLLLWLSVTGRLADVWAAAVGAASGVRAVAPAGGSAEGVAGAIPVPLPRIPTWGETMVLPSPTRYLPGGATVPGSTTVWYGPLP